VPSPPGFVFGTRIWTARCNSPNSRGIQEAFGRAINSTVRTMVSLGRAKESSFWMGYLLLRPSGLSSLAGALPALFTGEIPRASLATLLSELSEVLCELFPIHTRKTITRAYGLRIVLLTCVGGTHIIRSLSGLSKCYQHSPSPNHSCLQRILSLEPEHRKNRFGHHRGMKTLGDHLGSVRYSSCLRFQRQAGAR